MKRKPWPKFICGECGKECRLSDYEYKYRMAKNKNGKLYCSIECSARANGRAAAEKFHRGRDENI